MQSKHLLIFAVFFIGFVAAQDIYKQIAYNFSGGSPQCSACSGKPGEYACSNNIGDWHGGKKDFIDPLSYEDYRNGYMLTKINATIIGTYDCYAISEGAVINVALNDETIEIKAKVSSYQCECGKCDGPLIFVNNINQGGFPNFHYGSYNTLSITTFNNVICLNSVLLNLAYTKPITNSTSFFLDFVTDNSTCTACIGAPGKFQCGNTGYKLNKNFRDPLPPNTVVTAVTLQWYSKSGGSNSVFSVTSYINTQTVSTDNVQNYRYPYQPNCNDCGGRIISPSRFYQSGFPLYNYMGENTVSFYVGGSTSILCISRVQVTLQYIYKS